MKIVISNEQEFAHYYIRLGFAKALTACGHDVIIWDIRKKSAFDMFDENPDIDILVTQTYNITDGVVKCLLERPYIRVTAKGSDWGYAQNNMDLNKYPILVANNQEIDRILKLHDAIGKPNFIDIHYTQNSVNQTHSNWISHGIKCVGLLSATDISEYINGQYNQDLDCDIGFVGGYWGYKSVSFDDWLIPLCQPSNNYKIKIFGNQPWPTPQYCGFIPSNQVRNLFVSSKICPNISEPHSQVYGHDIIERPFKILSSKGFCISDYVSEMAETVFGKNLIYAASPSEFKEKIDYYLKNENERQKMIELGYNHVMNNHTYFHRAAQFFTELELHEEAKKCINIYNQIRKDNNI